MKKLSILFVVLFSIAFISCKDNHKEAEPEVATVDNSADAKETYEVAQTDVEFNDPKVEAIFKQYLHVENALVNTDAEKTAAQAAKLELLMKEQEVDAETHAAVAAMAEAKGIDIQRENFETLSMGMEKLLQGSLNSGTLYKQHCPMAFNNKGASWISSSREILNPYFGDKMLKCGRVEAEIR